MTRGPDPREAEARLLHEFHAVGNISGCKHCKRMEHLLREREECPARLRSALDAPIPMLLDCPACGLRHIDAPDSRTPDWTNPPHKSHLCRGCGHVWRPCDRPTEGVASLTTKGKADSPPATLSADVSRLTAERDAMEGVVKAARVWFDSVEQGFASPVRPDVARRDVMRALAVLDGTS